VSPRFERVTKATARSLAVLVSTQMQRGPNQRESMLALKASIASS
jgi:hypothetical protein